MMRATALAHSNIALVKYWGKRDTELNLPAAGSVSLTLDGLTTRTTVEFDPALDRDHHSLDGSDLEGASAKRLSSYLDLCWYDDERPRARVISANDFPTAAGLASSASGFAALAMAATAAAELQLSEGELSVLARRGSGSAARSIVSGYAWMSEGEREDGNDCYAYSIAGPEYWDLRCVIALTRKGPKEISSTDGMNHTMNTSPYYSAWVDSVTPAMELAKDAIMDRDFDKLADVAEASCLQMHASAIASQPGVIYWNGATVEVLKAVRTWRARGRAAFFTIDAGPHVKVFCEPQHADEIRQDLEAMHGVQGTIMARPGHGARVLGED